MRKAFSLVIFLLYFSLNQVLGQDIKRCSSTEYQELRESKNPALKKSQEAYQELLRTEINKKLALRKAALTAEEPIYRIPVVVHIVHNNTSGVIGGFKNSNISEEQILSQIQVLNEDYRKIKDSPGDNDSPVGADTKIEFCLATRDPFGNTSNGIVRVYSSKSSWSLSDDEKLKSLSYWPSDQYLNIWVTDLGSGLIGYAQFPESDVLDGMESPFDSETDGVVIDYECFGTIGSLKPLYNRGRTATHEIGHWLGLRHIWGDRSCGDDYVDDTPWDRSANDDKNCTDSSDCDRDGIYIQDMTNNFLDYSPDVCMNVFTTGQKLRMRTVIETNPRRKSVINSPGCCGSLSLSQVPFKEDFENYNDTWATETPGLSNVELFSPGAHNSSFSQKFINKGTYDSTSNSNEYSYFISPDFTFSNNENPSLAFDMAYTIPASVTNTDSLVISYSVNCGKWELLTSLTGEELITTNRNESDFTPVLDDWKTFDFKIPGLKEKTVGNIRFEVYSKNINNLYLDNINIYETSPNLSLSVYPNPASENLNLVILFEGEKTINFSLHSIVGNLILENTIQNTKSLTVPVNVSGLSEGIYVIKASNGKETAVKRIVVKK